MNSTQETLVVSNVFTGNLCDYWADFPNGEEIELHEFDECPIGYMPINVSGEDFTGKGERLFAKIADI